MGLGPVERSSISDFMTENERYILDAKYNWSSLKLTVRDLFQADFLSCIFKAESWTDFLRMERSVNGRKSS